MLAVVAEAEDVVQERSCGDERALSESDEIDSPKAWVVDGRDVRLAHRAAPLRRACCRETYVVIE